MKQFMIAIALTLPLTLATPGLAADISIATVGPMTGQYASFGEQMRRGAEQAVADQRPARHE